MDYYLNVHMPMSIERLSAAEGFVSVSVEEGVSGPVPHLPPTYIAACNYTFTSLDAFMAAFMPYAELLKGDIINYTDTDPVIQVNEVRIYL